MKRLLTMLVLIFFSTIGFAQNINKAEYFFDHDPGQGNGSAITITSPGQTVSFPVSIPLTDLNNGFHFLGIRVQDTEGKWSRFEHRSIYILSAATANTGNITAAEYFFDADPGPGNGFPVSVGASGAVVNFPAVIPANLSPGFHFLGLRTKDADGKWGFFERRSFYIMSAAIDMPGITAAEYFYDHDPGVGNGETLPIMNPGYVIAQTFMIPVPATMSAGKHLLAMRVKNQAGHWSLFEKDSINVTSTSTISCPGNMIVTAAGQCNTVVNNIDPTITPQGSEYTYTLTGATTGNGNGTASGHSFNAGITTVTYSLSNEPTVTCSFTVTVNTNVAPSVSINTSTTSVCSNTQATFTATPVNGGSPTYQWRLNGIVVGNSSNTFQHSSWSNGDAVSVLMFSSLPCANPTTALSNTINMSVTTVTPSVNIAASQTMICSGQQVTFTATPVNGGSTPTYQWKLNGNNIPGATSSIYQSSSLLNDDVVSVVMTPSLTCVSQPTATSNLISIAVNPVIMASVGISASEGTPCSGQLVIFQATPVNGGANPIYQWKINGNNVGVSSSTYQTTALANGDQVSVVMTSSLVCASPSPVTSPTIEMFVTPILTPSVSISASATTICMGTPVTFTATPVNGGGYPVYQWKLNGANVGSDSATYYNSALGNNDVVTVEMTPSVTCASPAIAVSNAITITLSSAITPSVAIVTSQTTICSGTQAIFTASPINGGATPAYQWKVNDINVGGNTDTYETSSLVNGDIVKVVMNSSLGCVSSSTATSNSIPMTVLQSSPAFVNIVASATTICSGMTVTFNATSTGGGNPTYQWKLNGNDVGGNSATYQNTSLQNGDKIKVVMTPSFSCAFPSPAVSNEITMTVNTSATPSVSIDATLTTICANTTVSFTASPTNGGNNPSYQWKLNGNNVGINDSLYENSDLANGDMVQVVMTSSLTCATPGTDTSNTITMTVTQSITYYADADEDGFGNAGSSIVTCSNQGRSGYVTNNTDCNDNNAAINPGALEICGNGIDDNCNGMVDENCNSTLPVLMTRTYPAKEGDAGLITLTAEVTLDKPATLPVSVHYSTSNEDAIAGADYAAASGVLTIPAGSSSGTVQLKIIGDLLKESNERFTLNFNNPVNVILPADPRSRIMIIDDDKGKVNNTIARVVQAPMENESLKIPSVTRRNQVWIIPQIGNYENEVFIMNTQGQVVSRFINYQNHTTINNVTVGLYFYRIRITEKNGLAKYYTGRLLITE